MQGVGCIAHPLVSIILMLLRLASMQLKTTTGLTYSSIRPLDLMYVITLHIASPTPHIEAHTISSRRRRRRSIRAYVVSQDTSTAITQLGMRAYPLWHIPVRTRLV